MLGVALVIGLATAADYGLSTDEFNTDEYGPKALAWYTSGFTNRSQFETVEEYLWMYGPWFQMLVAAVQSLDLASPITVRHAMTFLFGLAGLAAVVPIARLTVGAWAGLTALALCLLTGYLYGNLFFAPIDVPFLFAMSWSTLSIVLMVRREVPSWRPTLAAGLATGLAIATRTGGAITHAYLVGGMSLCALEALLRHGRAGYGPLRQIALHTLLVILIAWLTAMALWPWLQIGNPLMQFREAYRHFATLDTSFEFQNWGQLTFTDKLPAWYIPGQLLARLPEGFLALLLLGMAVWIGAAGAWTRATFSVLRRSGVAGLRPVAAELAGARAVLVVSVAAFGPIAVLILQGLTLYDGVRHVLFVIPMLAIVAARGLTSLLPFLRRLPIVPVALGVAHTATILATLIILHPLEYIAMNGLAGGVAGAYGRFDLDYWSMAAPEAVRRLEARIDAEGRFVGDSPRVLLCLAWREQLAGVMFHRNWIAETDLDKADYLIATERWPCAKGTTAVLVDEVKRFGRPFAWIYANSSRAR
ncbi:hypothetical protein MTX26_07340 [Bradyrhizobium sp. ISRA443]|uniref:hypothetical protein n=1 Tax=unclassified Bradyrhizobium TaxID=2631580 RepID=UPI00247AFFE5|nr:MULTISPECIES: hypothetical protein [unclassified Bradyrhizobium]WGR95581.1 hypothetical protein MTX20_17590 [Bradyrhizobium sp. ISRA435]WGS00639.1 hypothetical protein MTX23_07335 [Bradyrhizobium sp. ISRA436]WGS07527.1 hypothetical protein MTX18_07335 [Bradyrhizobium sp. ISRA437]WGS14414.1 hypothetical protein MTX26_07340 [Bradyrhizobium sp. ISRA443]